MSWQERDYASDDPTRRFGRPGGDWRGLRPSLDNPMTWSVPAGRVFGIDVRIHLVFVFLIVVEVLRAVYEGLGPALTLILLGSLFSLVLLHEFGHCFACRLTGGDADEILMWPLGGLAFTRPPHRWLAHLVTTAGGPAVNVAIAAVLIPLLGVLTGVWWGVAIPNPFVIDFGLKESVFEGSWTLITLYLLNWSNLILLLFNVLVPMFPLDGGRMLQALLWRWMGYARSMRIAVRAGYVGAIIMGVLGFVVGHLSLCLIAVFGGITCWLTHKQLEFTQAELGLERGEYGESLWGPDADTPPQRPSRKQRRAQRRAQKLHEREQREAAAVDEILRKIAERGMDSLTAAERRLLRETTRRKREVH